MENLERISEESPMIPVDPSPEDNKYSGLELVEETVYKGGTGVKYWM